jgi:hypothetical protein
VKKRERRSNRRRRRKGRSIRSAGKAPNGKTRRRWSLNHQADRGISISIYGKQGAHLTVPSLYKDEKNFETWLKMWLAM